MGLVNKPETFLQLLLSPPQTLHLSNFFLEPSFPSQPALMHLPWTQTEVESGEQGVPSTTCTRVSKTGCCISPCHPTTPPGTAIQPRATQIHPAGPEEMLAGHRVALCSCSTLQSGFLGSLRRGGWDYIPFLLYLHYFLPFLLHQCKGNGPYEEDKVTPPVSVPHLATCPVRNAHRFLSAIIIILYFRTMGITQRHLYKPGGRPSMGQLQPQNK